MDKSKKNYIIAVAAILLLAAGIFFYQKDVKPQIQVQNFVDCVKTGFATTESYPRQCKTPQGKSFAEDIGNELEKKDLIFITNPRPNEEIQSPLTIEGAARGNWYFEASFPIKLLDESGKQIAILPAQAQEEWMTTNFVPFKVELSFESPLTEKGTLVLEKDNPSGLPENADELRIPVFFKKSLSKNDTLKVKAFFNNKKLDPEFSCNKVFPVYREIPKTQAVARAALEELFLGPNERDKSQDFLTSINSGVKINSLVVDKGIARADFDEQLELQVGGSCRVAAIRAQIVQTLKQFPTVESVIISINGRTEDILQP